jgi:hypothetical protein
MKRLFFLLLIAVTTNARAASITTANQLFFSNQETFMKLTDFENLVDNDHNGVISPGDELRGIFTIQNSQNSSASQIRTPSGFELTGAFDALVSRVAPTGGSDALFEFVPTSGAGSFAATYGAGAMIAVFNDTSPDFTAAGTVASTTASATDGSLYLVLGANPANGVWGTNYYWAAVGSANPGIAVFSASLQTLTNNTGISASLFNPEKQPPPSNTGTGSFTNGANLANIQNSFALQGNTAPQTDPTIPYAIQSQDPLRANVVPEPTTIVTCLLLSLTYVASIRRLRAH